MCIWHEVLPVSKRSALRSRFVLFFRILNFLDRFFQSSFEHNQKILGVIFFEVSPVSKRSASMNFRLKIFCAFWHEVLPVSKRSPHWYWTDLLNVFWLFLQFLCHWMRIPESKLLWTQPKNFRCYFFRSLTSFQEISKYEFSIENFLCILTRSLTSFQEITTLVLDGFVECVLTFSSISLSLDENSRIVFG